MAIVYQASDTLEPWHDTDAEQLGNTHLYGVISGCGLTYDAADLTVDIAAGTILHNGSIVAVSAQANAVTLVADGTNPRWAYISLDSSGTAALTSGTAAATPSKPEAGDNVILGMVLIEAAQTIANNIAVKLDKRVWTHRPTSFYKYKTADQTRSADTTFVDVTASSGNLSFDVAANDVWEAEWYIPLSFTSTGGAKFQVTGPATPTNVHLNEISTRKFLTDNTSPISAAVPGARAFVTSFSSAIAAANADTSAATQDTWRSDAASNWIIIKAKIENGANAGTVALQFANNSAAGTVVALRGSFMRATRMM